MWKKKQQILIYVDLNSDNKQFKKNQRVKLSIVEVKYKEKKNWCRDIKREQKLKRKLAKKNRKWN